MSTFNYRRQFLKKSGGVLAGFAMAPTLAGAVAATPKRHALQLGLASYSLRKFDVHQTLDMAKQVGLDHLCLKSMHLPIEGDKATIDRVLAEARAQDQSVYAVGVIYMKTKEDVDAAFAYARRAGTPMIVGVPNHELLDYTEERIKEYDIKVAIHNHGPGDELYPSPESIYDKIKDRDKRLGICLDIGHTKRIGIEPHEAAAQYFDRLFDIHMKDVDAAAAEGKTVEIGRGIIDILAFLKVLTDKKYGGVVAFEYEKDEDAPLPGLAESVGYVKGVLATMV